jgi:hypothetical protein
VEGRSRTRSRDAGDNAQSTRNRGLALAAREDGGPSEIYASAEEGARLMREFVRIKKPDARAAIIRLARRMAEVKVPTKPVQS